MGHEKAGWKVAVCVRAHGKDLPLTPQRKHMRAQPPPFHHIAIATVPSPRATRARYTRRHVEEKGRRRAAAGGGK